MWTHSRTLSLSTALLAVGCQESGVYSVNSAPIAAITFPAEGDDLTAGALTARGVAEDTDSQPDTLVASWLVNGEQVCPTAPPESNGLTTCELFLEAGTSTLTLEVRDAQGRSGSTSVGLDVQPYGDPWAEIASPTAGDVYYSDHAIELEGMVGDAIDGAEALVAWWESDLDTGLSLEVTPSAGGSVLTSTSLIEGEHRLSLWVENTGGNRTYDTVTIDVGPPNSAPSCAIQAPEDGAEFDAGELVTFVVEVADADVPADWLGVSWTSHIDGSLGSTPPSQEGLAALPVADLSAGAHNVSVEVADEQGATCSDWVIVTIQGCEDIWFEDNDGDGYGDPAVSVTACEPPGGWVADSSDCDDGDASIHPTAPEICENGVDEDCDGSDISCSSWGVIDLASADASNTAAGTCVTSLSLGGDLDGDGFDDLVVGDTWASGAHGGAWIYRGPVTGSLTTADADDFFDAGYSYGWGGSGVAIVPDMNADGMDELLVGSYGADIGAKTTGAVFLMYGPATAASSSGADAVWSGTSTCEALGFRVAPAGDVDDDGTGDLLFVAQGSDGHDCSTGEGTSYVYMLHGSASLAGTTSIAAADLTLTGATFGSSVAAGDVDGDGFDDILVGTAASEAYLFLGPASGTLDAASSANTLITGEASDDRAGYSLGHWGDVNGDGYSDLHIGAYGDDEGATDAGAAYVVLGPVTAASLSLASADAKLIGESADDRAGSSLQGGDDLDGDGLDDVQIGAPYNDDAATDAGATYIVYGPLTGSIALSGADAKLLGTGTSEGIGRSDGGDADGDGATDIAVLGTTGNTWYLLYGGGP